jgi:hypothetical protein
MRPVPFLLCVLLCTPITARAQAGPPFQTNDPGTPGNGNWEINIASAQTVGHGSTSIQAPQIDLNYGLGDRVQLTYEVPYVVQSADGHSRQTGWSNAFPGIKWRFLDQGEGGWQASVFPQFETRGSSSSQRNGIASEGSRFLLPVQVTKSVGPIDVDFEAGYYLPKHGISERILGVVVGRSMTQRLDLGLELYNDRTTVSTDQTTLGLGGRFKLSPSFIALFMAGRGVSGTANGQPDFIGYFGIQVLLSDYGRALGSERTAEKAVP